MKFELMIDLMKPSLTILLSQNKEFEPHGKKLTCPSSTGIAASAIERKIARLGLYVLAAVVFYNFACPL